MKKIMIPAVKRKAFGKKESKAIRRSGFVPCVVYGGGETIHFSVGEKELKQLIYTPNSYIVDFDFGDGTEQAVMREVQYHPVREQVLHIDFFRVIDGKPVVVDIPVKLEGNSEGVKVGGKLILSKRKLTVSGLVEHLPDELVIDVTALELGSSIFVGDLNFENLTLLNSPSTAICAVKMTRAARGAAAAAEE